MIGRTISHYRIEEELGRGGMGVVYRARDERLRRDVALKVLSDEVASRSQQRARILAEARAACALNHPVITTIYEVGEEGEQLFLVMELVAGKTLRAHTAERMEPRMLVEIAAQVADGLAAAHTRGIVHGDVKPENIMVQPDGRVKLLDFGIARHTAAETLTLTQTATAAEEGQIAGTLAYLAPERWRGEEPDARTDLFALGVVMYEAAAGHRPFAGPTAMTLMAQVLQEAPLALGARVTGVPAELERIVHKLLEKRPDSRYQTARDLHADLHNLAGDWERTAATPAPAEGRPANRTVAVLPFKLLTPNAEDEYLGVALADAVINQLSAGGELLVRPTSVVAPYGQRGTDPLRAGRELNVHVVVDGSIQKFGERLRVHVQAWNAADGTSLVSGRHDSEMADLFGLQDQIAETVARALGTKPAALAAAAEPPTKDSKAYECFLRAAERLARLNRWDMHTAIELLENATRLDPRFADAWARLAAACIQMGVTFEPGPQWFRKAEPAIRKALALDANNADAICARGQVLWTPVKKFQNRAALRAHAQALRLNPGCHQARIQQALIFMHVGLLEQAKEGLLEALATDPDDTRTLTFIGQAALFQGNYEEGEEYMARALRMDPAGIWANLFLPTAPLYRRQPERAAEKLQASLKVLPAEPTLRSVEAMVWAHRGEKRKAERAIERALKGGKPVLHTHHLWHNVAAAYALIGKPERALAWLRKAAGLGLPNYPLFRDDPHFASLHSLPKFMRLMADLKKEWNGYEREFGRRGGDATRSPAAGPAPTVGPAGRRSGAAPVRPL